MTFFCADFTRPVAPPTIKLRHAVWHPVEAAASLSSAA
eukprot:CAMPEP_0171684266 /NCGR_PEP_ID=MMETSP0991-20121206/1584_1 /TAXON_ID=483369 /ORGANISM="non described non described, Strain CCMP2098" /LENGTH=37 /DNA_ID= /DNA_START= /DNA_END= /DNA_ORIENTATION=